MGSAGCPHGLPQVLHTGGHLECRLHLCRNGEWRPLFPGNTDSDQLLKIFKMLGTPSETTWPTITELPDWKPDFPQYEQQAWPTIVPNLDTSGIDLLQWMLQYYPDKRVAGRPAMEHEYFRGLSEAIKNMK